MRYSLRNVVEIVAAVTGQDPETIRNQFRFWVAEGLVPAAEISGTGTGTRRRYDQGAVILAAILTRLAQLGVAGEEMRNKAEFLGAVLTRRGSTLIKSARSKPLYLVGLVSGAEGGIVMTEFASEPTAALLEDVPGGAAFIVDISGLVRKIEERA